MTLGHVSVNTNLPLLPLQQFGTVGAETAALFLAIGTMCFLTRMAIGAGPAPPCPGADPVVVSVVLANQRAVLVNLAVVVLVGAPGGRRRTLAGSLAALSRRVRPGGAGRAGRRRGGHRRRGRSGRGGPAAGPDPARLELPEPLPQRRQGGIGPGPPEPGRRGGEPDPPAPAHRVGPRDRVPVLRSRVALGGDDRLRPQPRARPVAPAGPHRPGDLLRSRSGRLGQRAACGSGEDIEIR